ncbi:hypothetical protein CPAV1605_1266 [seawater metagenome]|uniref:CCHC-type domain-containing protein n=1 Tax=seawater metagenome TaxID=1561972 RepID=A0A5E8CM01_9ZZZZ
MIYTEFNKNKNGKIKPKKNIIESDNNNTLKKSCHYCGSFEHLCRECPIEKANAASYKLIIGKWAERYVAKYPCPNCKQEKLEFLGDHTPSLDVKCKECGHMIEVKSKCLSVKKLPSDIYMFHGNYNFYQQRVEQGLTFVFVVYAVDRRTKTFNVRKVFYVDNKKIKAKKQIQVRKIENGNNSKIFIPNTHVLESWKVLKT